MPDILLLPDLCDALGTSLDLLLRGKHSVDTQTVGDNVGDFCEYAVKNGRAETVRQAISRMMDRDCVVQRNDKLSVCFENGNNILVSDPLGMGFVMSGTDFKKYCLDMSGERINSLLRLIADESTLAVIKVIAKKTATLDEICAETGMEKANVLEVVLELSNYNVTAYGKDKNGRTGYCPASGMVPVLMVLAGCSLYDLEGVRGQSWVTV